ncbi:magnesium and cobalt transport [Fusarium beomiforme]|uniref:Magnesium and cobalt transport n=1 Tax=Fusarium beomiforme TaxID=44412 RepID=A0A9P5AND4_9HYPO|nr:magnesium and cobalt transport [Fusarium beomiforme]
MPELQEIVNRMQEYRKTMNDSLESYQFPLHPWQDREHSWEGRLKVFHFHDGKVQSKSPRLDRRNNPQHLWQDINQALEQESSKSSQQSLLLMEGMDARTAEALSIKLDIPHEFWTAHYIMDGRLRFIEPSSFESTKSSYWKIMVPSKHSIVWDEMPSESVNWSFGHYSGSCPRNTKFILDPETTFINMTLFVSFWGRYTPEGWIDQVKVLDDLITGNMTMYAQRAAMDEAFATRIQAHESYLQTKAANEQAAAANRTARSSGQLAKIATVAVPCTVAASILSMNGEFAAGERFFFVYWCVALPLTLALLGWVLQKDLKDWRDTLRKKQKDANGDKEHGSESSRNGGTTRIDGLSS